MYSNGMGVYRRSKKSTFEGGHAVRVLGWGVDGDKPYWLVANTWSKDWGYDGFVIYISLFFECILIICFFEIINRTFKIYRGTNECGFEDRVAAGIPILN